MLKDFIHLFVLSCEKATYLTEKQLHTNLSRIERIQLRLHLSICGLCAASHKKTTLLHRIMIARAQSIENEKGLFKIDDIENFKSSVKDKLKNQN